MAINRPVGTAARCCGAVLWTLQLKQPADQRLQIVLSDRQAEAGQLPLHFVSVE